MRKIMLTIFLMLTIASPTFAKNVKVEALEDFSTANPPQTWSVRIVEGFTDKNGHEFFTNSIIEGRIEDVTGPKRLKRNATFRFVPINYFDYNTQEWYVIEQDITAKYSNLSDIDAKKVAKAGVITVGNKLLDGYLGPSVALIEGVVKNECGNRAKSAVVSVYESTPLSYANKGKQIEIKKGQVFIMSLKIPNETTNEEEASIE